jgi:hypothetical protein
LAGFFCTKHGPFYTALADPLSLGLEFIHMLQEKEHFLKHEYIPLLQKLSAGKKASGEKWMHSRWWSICAMPVQSGQWKNRAAAAQYGSGATGKDRVVYAIRISPSRKTRKCP